MAAITAKLSLSRLNGLFTALPVGLVTGLMYWHVYYLDSYYAAPRWWGFSASLLCAHGLSVACLALAILALPRADGRRAGSRAPRQDFLRCADSVRCDRQARVSLLGMAWLRLLVVMMSFLHSAYVGWCYRSAIPVFAGVAVGSLLPCLGRDLRVVSCFVPLGFTWLTTFIAFATATDYFIVNTWSWTGFYSGFGIRSSLASVALPFVAGLAIGMAYVPLLTIYQLRLAVEMRGMGMALLGFTQWLAIALLVWLHVVHGVIHAHHFGSVVTAATGIAAV
jgi:hypothetical protein